MMMKNWIRSLMFSVCLVGVGLAPSDADAALNAYLKLKGEKTGEVKGSVTQKGREGQIDIVSLGHEILSPRDPQSGLPTGKRQHKPMVIRKEIDKSTPILNQMLVTNEKIKTWEMGVFLPNAKGVEAQAYTIKLTNANIASIKLITDEDGKLFEEITFTYQKIEWTWVDGGITAMDDWETPVSK